MLQGFLFSVIGMGILKDVLSNLDIPRKDVKYFKTVIQSEVILTKGEQELWNRPDINVELRVALYRRGLRRTRSLEEVSKEGQ